MSMNRQWIAAHIPHQGGMCLLDEVIDWSANGIRCRSGTHRLSDNPLRGNGRLDAICAIEYAAQAMAVHGALIGTLTGAAPAAGYLASVREVSLFRSRLDDVTADLVASSTYLGGDESAVLYQFSVTAADAVIASGRATIILNATRRARNS
jgi:predicted hotdog family 3-hydroxylacyl-ACP dehydratase